MLTETSVGAFDRRAVFVGVDAYQAAGGTVSRDLFQGDDGGWLKDPALLDRLVAGKLQTEAAAIAPKVGSGSRSRSICNMATATGCGVCPENRHR